MVKWRTLLSEVLFYTRVIVFCISCLGFNGTPIISLAIIGIIILTWVIDFLLGNTTWISTRWETYALFIPFLTATGWLAQLAITIHPTISALALIALMALSSDAISNSQRWQKLLFVMLLSIIIVAIAPQLWTHGRYPAYVLKGIPAAQILYALIPGFACLARLFFPRTKHLIHTSLDYPPIRLEVLSFGMKRPSAIGIKKM